MSDFVLDVELVCTDADLEDLVLGASNLQGLLPDEPEWMIEDGPQAGKKTALKLRKKVLRTVLQKLEERRPPIFANQLVDPSQLKDVVAYGVLELLYRGKIEHDDSPNIALSKSWGSQHRAEFNALAPTVRAGATASSISFRVSRG